MRAPANRNKASRRFHRGFGNPTYSEAVGNHEGDEPYQGCVLDRVYFLHFPELRRVKIGWTRNVEKRRRAVRHSIPFSTQEVLLGCLRGGRLVERLMHERFAQHRISGEWFDEAIIEDAESLIRADEIRR